MQGWPHCRAPEAGNRQRERVIKSGRTCQSATLREIERKPPQKCRERFPAQRNWATGNSRKNGQTNSKVWMQNLMIKRWVGTRQQPLDDVSNPSGTHWGTSNRQSAEQGRDDADCHGPVGRTRRRESRGTLTLEGQQWSLDGSQIHTGELDSYLGDYMASSPSQMDEVTGYDYENESDSEDDQSQIEADRLGDEEHPGAPYRQAPMSEMLRSVQQDQDPEGPPRSSTRFARHYLQMSTLQNHVRSSAQARMPCTTMQSRRKNPVRRCLSIRVRSLHTPLSIEIGRVAARAV